MDKICKFLKKRIADIAERRFIDIELGCNSNMTAVRHIINLLPEIHSTSHFLIAGLDVVEKFVGWLET